MAKEIGTGCGYLVCVCVFLLECRMWGYLYLKMYRSSVGPSPLCDIYIIFLMCRDCVPSFHGPVHCGKCISSS